MTQNAVALQWPRLGPYHLARIDASDRLWRSRGGRAVAIEIAAKDEVYAWRMIASPTAFERHTLFPGETYEAVSTPKLYRRLTEVLDDVQPRAMALSGYYARESWIALLWCRRSHCLPVLMSESKADDRQRRSGTELLKRFIVKRFAAALCGGSLHKEYLIRLGMAPERVFCGYDAVDNSFFSRGALEARVGTGDFANLPGLASVKPFFLASSRFIPRKNLLTLLEAYRRYRALAAGAGEASWRLVILGDGPERRALENFVAERQLPDVTLAGFQQIETLPVYYGRAAVFIHPALQEQWGLVVNEAMASGLPVLVSERCGCVPELVHKGVNGFTFAPDNVDQLAELMLSCSSGALDLAKMGRASQRIVSQWSPDRFAHGLSQAVDAAAGAPAQVSEPCTS